MDSSFQVTYIFVNRSERVQEFVLAMEPSEAFMLSGNKQVKLFEFFRYETILNSYATCYHPKSLPIFNYSAHVLVKKEFPPSQILIFFKSGLLKLIVFGNA